jgi:hypothetical protein
LLLDSSLSRISYTSSPCSMSRTKRHSTSMLTCGSTVQGRRQYRGQRAVQKRCSEAEWAVQCSAAAAATAAAGAHHTPSSDAYQHHSTASQPPPPNAAPPATHHLQRPPNDAAQQV